MIFGRKPVISIVASLVLVACSGSDVAPSDNQTVGSTAAGETSETSNANETAEFCVVLNEELQAMQSASAGASGTDQLLLFVQNVSVANRLISRLNDVAPDEISADMEIVHQAWDDQADATAKAFSDPAGAFGASLVSSILASGSFTAVDAWSQRVCGRPAFGFGVTSVGSTPCAWLPSAEDPFEESVGIGASFTDLTSALTSIVKNSPGAGEPAQALLDAMDDLDGTPRKAREGIGRLHWTASDPDQMLSAVDSAIVDECFVSAFGSDALGDVAEVGPELTRDRELANPATLWGLCGSPVPADDGFLVYSACGEHPTPGVAALDTRTGKVTWIDAASRFDPVIAGTHIFEATVRETPASGLDPARAEASLTAYSLRTGEEIGNADFGEVDPDGFSDTIPGTPTILATGRNRIVAQQGATGDARGGALVVYDESLTELARFDAAGCRRSGAVAITANSAVVSTGNCTPPSEEGQWIVSLLDGKSAALGDTYARALDGGSPGEKWVECYNRRLLYIDGTTAIAVLDNADGVRVSRVVAPEDGNFSDSTLLRDSVVVGDDGSFGIRASDLAGNTLWTLGAERNLRTNYVGGFVVARNEADEIIVVDGITGTEASSVGAYASSLLEWAYDETFDQTDLRDVYFDVAGDEVVFMSGARYAAIPSTEICPTADGDSEVGSELGSQSLEPVD